MSKSAQERFNRLLSLAQSGDLDAAGKAVAAALQATPKDPNILHLAAQIAENRKETERAAALYRRALVAYPHWFEAGMNLARVLANLKQTGEALATLKSLAPHHPQRPEPLEALARLAQAAGDLPQAAEAWRRALTLRPAPESLGQYHFCLAQLCDWTTDNPSLRGADATKQSSGAASAAQESLLPRACPRESGDAAAGSPRPFGARDDGFIQPLSPNPDLPPNITAIFFDDPALQKDSAERFCARRFGAIKPLPTAPAYNHKRLRVGYLSSDFHAHATSWLMAELFALHDRAQFEVFVYSYGIEDHSEIRGRLRREAEHFVELNTLTAAGCAARIRADEIDILVDLKGHTTGAHLDILAYRPAPRQLHWLGFPATLGAAFLDGFVADSVVIPEGSEAFFTEKVLRLPHCYQINDRQKTIAAPRSKSAHGLPDDALVFASFNQTYKITPAVFAVWCELLGQVPTAVLWLLESNAFAPDTLRRAAQERGLDPARLYFAKNAPQAEHLARYHAVDVALDTFPVGGHTTTSDALWAGAPVVTLAGKSFVTRVAASLLTAAELPQLITTSLDDYKALALRLAGDADERERLRTHLRDHRTTLPLFNTPQFVKDFEGLLLKKL